uniref:Agglutinin C-terminal domain-containing protein n=1 Tax=viral metagenome TaxID=1070528 RepID=A0A6M3XY58_9ZZZZ
MILGRNDLALRLVNRTGISAYQIDVLDGKKYCPTYDEVAVMLLKTNFEKYKYKNDVRDCDKFAVMLWGFVIQHFFDNPEWEYGWAFGLALGKFQHTGGVRHALNFAFTQDRDLIFPEPQNDHIYLHDGHDRCDRLCC